MKILSPRRLLLSALIALLLAGQHPAQAQDVASTIATARTLAAQQKFQALFDLLAPLEGQYAGDSGFDFLLGAAAVNIGEATRGVFALERVLEKEPNNAEARALIARAYFELGETTTARKELQNARDAGVPLAAQRTIDKFLATINRLSETGKTRVEGYVDASIGRDTNVNSGPVGSSIAIPAIGGLSLQLPRTLTSIAADFASLGGGVSLWHPLQKELALTVAASGTTRALSHDNQFSSTSVDANVGLNWRQRREVFSVVAQFNTFQLDSSTFRNAAGVIGQWQHNFDAQSKSVAYVQYSGLDYPGNSIRNADRWTVGGAYVHALRGYGTVLYGGAYAGEEKERSAGVPQNGHRFLGLRGGFQRQLGASVAGFVNLSYEERRYGGPDPLFLATRSDRQTNLGVGLDWEFADKWRVIPQIFLSRNRANIALYEFNRDVYTIQVRREF